MFYDSLENNHGLPHDPFKAIVAPRPIGWIGSKGNDGSRNLAPYSFFNAIADKPHLVVFSSMGEKDSLRNCTETGVFSANMVGMSQIDQMSKSSASLPYGEDEFSFSDLEAGQCELIDAPYVKGAYSVLECKVTDILRPKTIDGHHPSAHLIFGQVIGIHIEDKIIVDGKLDLEKVKPVTRLGYRDYAAVETIFELKRPDQK